MSATNRTSSKGGKNVKADNTDSVKGNTNKSQKNEKTQKNSQTGKQNQAKTNKASQDQLRNANANKDQSEHPDVIKIKTVMDITKKSEDAVTAALAEADNDLERAVELLLESPDFEFIAVSRKKPKPAVSAKTDSPKEKTGTQEESTFVNNSNGDRRGRGRGRGGGLGDRGGKFRNRENKENERSQDDKFSDFNSDKPRRGGPRMSNGPGRFERGRGGRGGRGVRTFQKSQDRDGGFPRQIEIWNNPGTEETATTGKMETWGGEFPSPEEWDNEEYTGSLADTKVFTPSTANDNVAGATEEIAIENLNSSFNSNDVVQDGGVPNVLQVSGEELRPPSPVTMPTTLTAAQSQYLSQLTAQSQVDKSQLPSSVYSSSVQPNYATVSSPSTSVSYTGTEFVNSYTSTLNDISNPQQVLPQRNKVPRTRVPPPSKIPASAVEMPPGDSSVNSGIGILDVQFGALDFGPEPTSYESSTETSVQALPKYSSQSADPISEHSYVNTSLAAAASQLKTNHASLTSSLTKNSESLLNSDTTYNSGRSTTFQELANMASKNISANQDVNLHSTPYDTPSFPQPSASLYQSKAPVVSTYSASSTTYSQPYSTASNAYSSASAYTTSNRDGSYSTSQYPSTTYTSSFVPSGYPGYQPSSTSQSYSYGNNVSGLGSTTYSSYQNNYSTTTSASSQHSHKLTTATPLNKDAQYDSISSSATPVSSVSSTPAGLSSLTQTTIASTKASTNPAASKTNVASIPPGVQPAVVGAQYIMSQAPALPFYQAPLYNFEDVALIPNRMPPHMTTGYYDLSFPAVTSLSGARDGSGLANVAYSMSDTRYARTDNNASPVPSSLSNQNASQTPLMNPSLPPAYYYYSAGIPSNPFQYSTPIYPTVNTGAYPPNQQPSKTTGSSQGVGPTQTPSSANTDLTANMYSKTHASLSKVNSYDKQGFLAGTPPPYNLQGVGSAVGGMGPSGTFATSHTYPPLMMQAGPQHHNTTLMHQPHLQDSSGNSTSRSQSGSQVNKTGSKPYYGNWNQN